MVRKKRHRISRGAVKQRRDRVLELRLAGLSAANIAEELRKKEVFKHTTEDTVWNDIKALKKMAKLEEIEYQPKVKEVFWRSYHSYCAIHTAALRTFKEIDDRIARVQEAMAEIDEHFGDPQLSVDSVVQLITQYDNLLSLAGKLRKQERDQTRVIMSIDQTLLDMPRKLGLVLERREVGADDAVVETIAKAVEDEPDLERKKEIIKAAKTLADVLR